MAQIKSEAAYRAAMKRIDELLKVGRIGCHRYCRIGTGCA